MKTTKKVLSVVLAAIMVLTMLSVGAFAANETGTVEAITEGIAVNSDDSANIVVTNEEVVKLDWAPANAAVGRWQDGWWIGIKVVAPADVDLSSAVYSSGGEYKSFNTYKDSKDGDDVQYITCWLPILKEWLEGAAAAKASLKWTYTFKWDGETEQNVVVSIDPAKVDLYQDGEHTCVYIDRVVDPTCTEVGYEGCFCICGEGDKEEIPALGHDDENNNGYCDVCGEFICDCLCHRVKDGTFNKILYKIVSIFWHLFHINYTCKCGKVHIF